MIRLFTSVFPVQDEDRRREFAYALQRNVDCVALGQICLLVEGNASVPSSAKVTAREIGDRPAYADYFRWIDELAVGNDVSIVANGDIFFDESIGVLSPWPFDERTALALSRWETRHGSEAVLNDRNDSQDAWVFQGKVSHIDGNFRIGVPRCDNRMVKELELAGYDVLNPAFSLRAYHVHNGDREEYPHGLADGFVPPPYGYVWPHNLWSLPRTLLHNITHPRRQVGWRFDGRGWRRALRVHWLERGWRALARGGESRE